MPRLLPAFCAVLVSGCADSEFRYGRDFPTEHVGRVVKGRTTAAEMRQWFGEPFSKAPLSATEERWLYTHAAGTARAQSFIVGAAVQSSSRHKTLDVLLRDGVVTNYTFTEGPGPTGAAH